MLRALMWMLVGATVVWTLLALREHRVLTRLSNEHAGAATTDQDRVLALCDVIHREVHRTYEALPVKAHTELEHALPMRLSRSLLDDWNLGSGCCGSFAALFIRTCQLQGIEARYLQLLDTPPGRRGAHRRRGLGGRPLGAG